MEAAWLGVAHRSLTDPDASEMRASNPKGKKRKTLGRRTSGRGSKLDLAKPHKQRDGELACVRVNMRKYAKGTQREMMPRARVARKGAGKFLARQGSS